MIVLPVRPKTWRFNIFFFFPRQNVRAQKTRPISGFACSCALDLGLILRVRHILCTKFSRSKLRKINKAKKKYWKKQTWKLIVHTLKHRKMYAVFEMLTTCCLKSGFSNHKNKCRCNIAILKICFNFLNPFSQKQILPILNLLIIEKSV